MSRAREILARLDGHVSEPVVRELTRRIVGQLEPDDARVAVRALSQILGTPLSASAATDLVKRAAWDKLNGDRRRLQRHDLEEMASSEPPEVPWVVEPLAAIGEVTVLYGAPGLGKSLLCLGLCNASASGVKDVAGLKVKRGRPLYIDAENGRWETHRRVRTLPNINAKRLAIYDALGVDLIRDFDEIAAVVEEHRASLVILDSLRRLLPGTEENDSGAMAEALVLAKLLATRYEAAVVVIHHPKKSGESYRGSSAIADQTSILYRLGRVDGDLDRLRRLLVNEKMRIAAEPDARFLQVGVEDGELVTELAFPPTGDELAKGPAQTDLTPQVLELLGAGPARRARIARALGRDKADGTVRRIFERLDEQGHIEQDENGVWHVTDGGVAKGALPSSSAVGNPSVAKSVASGNPPTTKVGNRSVAKGRRARQPAVGNPTDAEEHARPRKRAASGRKA